MKHIKVSDESGTETLIMYKRSDNVAIIKRNIRKAIYLNETQMQLYDGDRQLNDNEYIENTTRLMYRELPTKSNDIIITVGHNTLNIPKLIQINPDEVISDLKDIIRDVSNINPPIAIFDESGQEFLDESLIKNCELMNDSVVKICLKRDCNLTLEVSNISANEASFNIQCLISDTIIDVKDKICSQLKLSEEISLFTEWSILKDDDRLIDYSFRNNDFLFYIVIDRAVNFEIGEKLKSGKLAKIYYGKNLLKNSQIILKRYNLKSEKFRKFLPFKSELTSLKKFPNDEPDRFVKLDCIFQTVSHFYIGMEFMEHGSLDAKIPLKTNDIIKYSIQILKALKFLHSHTIVYRNLKCSNLLLDANDNLKICNFHLSKTLMDFQSQKVVENIFFTKHIEYNWTAPEVLEWNGYDITADIWSFGATLIEMLTGKPPYSQFNQDKVRTEIVKTKTIVYDEHFNPSPDLDNVIKLCLKSNPSDRPTAEQLEKTHPFLNSQLESNNH